MGTESVTAAEDRTGLFFACTREWGAVAGSCAGKSRSLHAVVQGYNERVDGNAQPGARILMRAPRPRGKTGRKIMKHLIYMYLLMVSLLVPDICAAGFIYGVDVAPANPGSSDFIVADIFGDFSSAGVTIPSPPLVTIYAQDIIIDLYSVADSCCGAAILVPYSTQAYIGVLSAGDYNLTANLYLNNILDDSYSGLLSVSSVPMPASIWLFSSGLLCLIGAMNRSRG